MHIVQCVYRVFHYWPVCGIRWPSTTRTAPGYPLSSCLGKLLEFQAHHGCFCCNKNTFKEEWLGRGKLNDKIKQLRWLLESEFCTPDEQKAYWRQIHDILVSRCIAPGTSTTPVSETESESTIKLYQTPVVLFSTTSPTSEPQAGITLKTSLQQLQVASKSLPEKFANCVVRLVDSSVRRSVDKRFEAFWVFQKYVLEGRDGLACCRRNVFFRKNLFLLKTRHLIVFCLSCIFLIFCKFLMVRIEYVTKKMLSIFCNIHFEEYRHSFSRRDPETPTPRGRIAVVDAVLLWNGENALCSRWWILVHQILLLQHQNQCLHHAAESFHRYDDDHGVTSSTRKMNRFKTSFSALMLGCYECSSRHHPSRPSRLFKFIGCKNHQSSSRAHTRTTQSRARAPPDHGHAHEHDGIEMALSHVMGAARLQARRRK